MKLHVLSDLHIEFTPFKIPETDADVVILAGDIHVKRRGLEWAKNAFPDRPVLYILGNHEYYGEAIPRHTKKLKELAHGSTVHVLENNKIAIGDVLFLGATLWTDFRLLGDPRVAGYKATQQMTDYSKIRVSPGFHKIRPLDTVNMHLRSRSWLAFKLEKNTARKIVAITHHAPSRRSLQDGYQADLLSAAYASHLDEFVEQSGATLWIHGHIHASRDYHLGKTRVLCNPKGYSRADNEAFDPGLVVEI